MTNRIEGRALLVEDFEGKGKRRRLLAEYPRAVPILIFLLVIAITLVSLFAIERGEAQREEADVNRRAQAMASAIERRAFTSTSYLRAGSALLSTQDEITSGLFRRFVDELRLDSNYRGAEGIGWAPVVTSPMVPEFEDRLSEGRVSRVRVTPSLEERPRPLLVPILFLRPDTIRNRRALGFDMYSEPVRRAAMDAARLEERPTASGPVTLAQEGGGSEPGFLIFMPVFRQSDMGRELLGFIYSPFNAPQFLESAAELVTYEGFSARLYDVDGGERELLAELPGWKGSTTRVERELDIAGRRMQLIVESARTDALSTMAMITLLFGLAVASLLMLIARLLAQQAVEDSRSLDWFAQQNSIRDSLTRELNHRVKNTLANVLSIVSLTRRRATDLDDFAEGIDGRIRALSATHDLLTKSEWGTTPIRSVAEVELAPYSRTAEHEVVLDGPDVDLAPNDALSFGLALHELATNAAKYGALSVEGGRVEIHWSNINERLAKVEWTERGGPLVRQPSRRGFGTELIEKIVAHELRHPVELEFDERGVRCTLLVPVRQPSEFALRAPQDTSGES
ncbi:CHASE domain-containing protein [Qipengyuania sp. XHP0207]|uniref:CHASE domain-containing protein n=1 Tax=Qipengyuania sp. XHP0207 TaxID=3038078 RepID=UPI00241D80AE|nr:CHASE domain-containing protein [Qipengyuania sp. XHP0207]MDG5747655.1 CHASE domain-containing protein [Qipengyuania sp. XHP0207]